MEAVTESASDLIPSSRSRSRLRVSILACAAVALSILVPLRADAQTPGEAEAICPNGSTCLWRDANWETLGSRCHLGKCPCCSAHPRVCFRQRTTWQATCLVSSQFLFLCCYSPFASFVVL